MKNHQSNHQSGVMSRMLAPFIGDVIQSQTRAVALHRAAAALVAATKHRLGTGSLPESLEALVPARLPSVPLDPFAADAPLHLKVTPEEFLVWSIGVDGENAGGPERPDAEHHIENDDVGLRMRVAAPPALSPAAP